MGLNVLGHFGDNNLYTTLRESDWCVAYELDASVQAFYLDCYTKTGTPIRISSSRAAEGLRYLLWYTTG